MRLIKISDAYDWAEDAARCYDLAVEMLREQYLAERLPGETAEPETVTQDFGMSCRNPV